MMLFVLAIQQTHMNDAKRAKAVVDLTEIQNALERFRVDTDRYPTTREGLEALVHRPRHLSGWLGPYVSKIPKDPWAHRYHYASLGNDQIFLASYGADGKKGGKGVNADIVPFAY